MQVVGESAIQWEEALDWDAVEWTAGLEQVTALICAFPTPSVNRRKDDSGCLKMLLCYFQLKPKSGNIIAN